MRTVDMEILKNRLRHYVRLAASGETITVTDRGQVVAELGPARRDRSQRIADVRLADAVRRGWVTPPVVVREAPPPSLPVVPLSEILAGLESDRADH